MDTGNMASHTSSTDASAARSLKIWRGLALVLAAIVAGLAFAAYTQPDLLLNISGLRYCG